LLLSSVETRKENRRAQDDGVYRPKKLLTLSLDSICLGPLYTAAREGEAEECCGFAILDRGEPGKKYSREKQAGMNYFNKR